MLLSTQEMIERMKIQFDGATVRLEIDIATAVDFERVAHDAHAWLTNPGDRLTLIGGSQETHGVHLMCIINTDEKGQALGERITLYLRDKYQCMVIVEWFEIVEVDAIELWNRTIDTAESAWSVNSKGGES